MLFNKSKNKQIIDKVKVANTHWKRMKGLMFEKVEDFNYALVFELDRERGKSASIHMVFVFFPIDVLFLSKEKKVVDIVKALKPFTPNYTPKERCNYFVELPEGKSEGIEIGNILEWKWNDSEEKDDKKK